MVEHLQAVSADSKKPCPDITLYLDLDGVIEQVQFSNNVPRQSDDTWIGRRWSETVEDISVDKVRRLLDDASVHGVSGFRQINQRLTNGAEVLMEYTAVRVGERGSLIVVGKSLKAVTRLQSRLIAAQQAMETDYWKLRQLETRYQRLFQSSQEATLVVTQADWVILEANGAAQRALDPSGEREDSLLGRSLLADLDEADHEKVTAMLARTLNQGAAPAVVAHIGEEQTPWLIHGSPLNTDRGQGFLLRLSPGRSGAIEQGSDAPVFSVAALVDGGPDAHVVVDIDGTVCKANRAFLEMVQVDAEGTVIGKRLAKWMGRPGPDGTVLMANVLRHGVVRMFSTTMQGEFGGETDVEISAVVDDSDQPRYCGVLIRDVGRRLQTADTDSDLKPVFTALKQQIGKKPLKKLVQETVSVIENHYIQSALKLTGGNRTAAAELLGLSRQSLYSKLDRYGLVTPTNDVPNSQAS